MTEGVCGCGRLSSHRGVCGHRYAKRTGRDGAVEQKRAAALAVPVNETAEPGAPSPRVLAQLQELLTRPVATLLSVRERVRALRRKPS